MSKVFTGIDVIRRNNTRKLMSELKLSRVKFAEQVEVSYPLLGHYIGKNPSKSIGDEIARRIEKNTGKPEYWLDHDHDEIGQPELAFKDDVERIEEINTKVPVISWVAAGNWTEVMPAHDYDAIDEVPKPKDLSEDGFALIVRGRSMLPEFKPNEIIFVEPNVGLYDLRDGDLIVVQCNDDTEATFKQLVIGDTSQDMYLKPLNPDWLEQEIRPMSECNLVGRVVGKYTSY